MDKTIVEYSDEKRPANMYPQLIVSPTKGKSCCAQNMEQIGGIEREENRVYFYRRCRVCGYTVRHFLAAPPPDGPSGSWEDETSKLMKLVV
jgi:rubrerythrin